jgi:hypothetical protein
MNTLFSSSEDATAKDAFNASMQNNMLPVRNYDYYMKESVNW